MSKTNAKIGIIVLVMAVICIAIIAGLYINNQVSLYDDLQMDMLTQKVEDQNLSFSVGFKGYEQSTGAYLNVTIDKIAIKERVEATFETIFNESYQITIEAPVDVIKFHNITTLHPSWTYRIQVYCIIPTHGEIREEEFYIFAE